MDILELAKSIGVQGFLHPAELEKLIELAAGKVVLEVGSFMGLSAWGMAWTAKHITCIDTFKANSAGQDQQPNFTTLQPFLDATARFNNVEHFIGESAIVYTGMTTQKYDMIFLDAMHIYEDVKQDIENWINCLRPGGIMAFHDYGHDHFHGVKRAVDEFFNGPLSDRVVTLAWKAT